MAMSLKHRAKGLLGQGLLSSGLHRAALGANGVIVAFHRVTGLVPEDGLTIAPHRFEQFCRFFRANFDIVTLGDIIARLRDNASIAGMLALTFDDGYLDNYEVAAPILEKLGMPATFFVTTKFIGSTTVPWWDRELPRRLGWMKWDHVHELARRGFDIGAHTRTHIDLGKADADEAQTEIAGSRADLAEQIGREPPHFAYPYGGRNNIVEENREIVRRAGFDCCVSSYGGLAHDGADPFRLQRVPISPWFETPEQFAFELVASKT